MLLIFGASTGAGSVEHTSRFIGPLLHWLFPRMDQESIDSIHFLIRKAAHLTEYAIMAVLWQRALLQPGRTARAPRRWPIAFTVIGICCLIAVADEFNQSFWRSRQGSLWDVLLDTVGAVIGIGVVCLIGKVFKR